MIALEGRIKVVEDTYIDIELFVPYSKLFYGSMFPIYGRFPNPTNTMSLNYCAGVTNISYQKVMGESKKYMKQPQFNGVMDLQKLLSKGNSAENNNDLVIHPIPCTLDIKHSYQLFDYTNLGGSYNIDMDILIDITDTKIRFHWRKSYCSNNNKIIIGSTEDSTAEMSYDDNNTIQFIVSDDSEVNNIIGVNIAAREIESDQLTKAVSIITPDIYQGSLYDVLTKSNDDWVYNTKKYVKETIKTIYETEVFNDTKKEDNNEQSGDNVQ